MTDGQSIPTIGDTIAARVRRYRQLRELSVRALADRCAALGMTGLTAASIGNIERGIDPAAKRRRREVTVEELMVLALALEVPPLLLMVPYGESDRVQIAPRRAAHPTAVAEWFGHDAEAGYVRELFSEAPISEQDRDGYSLDRDRDASSLYERSAAPIQMYNRLRRIVDVLLHDRRAYRMALEHAAEAQSRFAQTGAAAPWSVGMDEPISTDRWAGLDDAAFKAQMDRAELQSAKIRVSDCHHRYRESLYRLMDAYAMALAMNLQIPVIPDQAAKDLGEDSYLGRDHLLHEMEQRWGAAIRHRIELAIRAKAVDEDANR